ncbi:MAG: hypothetical protein JST39_22050, partial [Bacteroidetes bacterium]|nr:hypothetical protein [Bacteroidota bacterium]
VKQAGVTNDGYIPSIPIATQGKAQTVAYFDGLGRPIQTVQTKGSASAHDIVVSMVYDSFGREPKKFLPYVETSATKGFGGYQEGWMTRQAAFYLGGLQGVDTSNAPFSQTVFESSPLSRVLAQGAPGTVWQPNLSDAYDTTRKVIKVKYENNKAGDSVRIFDVDSTGAISSPGFYGAELLMIKTSIDEHNGVIKEYTDKSGHVLLKRVFIENDSLQTYYIYDDFDLLRAVIQPEGVAGITGSTWTASTDFAGKWMFLYRYDGRNRMVMKKVPGADSVLMVYDQWDRMVLTQDGNQRSLNNWLFTKYDALNRPIVTGLITDTRSQATIRAVLDTASGRYETVNTSATEGYTLTSSFPSSGSYTLTLFTITHYDSYSNLPSWSSGYAFVVENGVTSYNNNLQGQVVATQTKILSSSNWLRTVSYYDDKYRAVQVTGDNPVGGKDRITKVLTFDGKVSQSFQSHTSNFYTTALAVSETYTYDHVDRLLKVTHKIGTNEDVTIAENSYNELGQSLTKKLHQAASRPGYLQKLDYRYNIRGWLNGINQPYAGTSDYDESDLFNFSLHYNTADMSGGTAQYNGNISE